MITRIENVGWISGFSGSSGIVLLTTKRVIFCTDSRYTEQAKQECDGFQLEHITNGSPSEIILLLGTLGENRIGFEANHLSFRLWQLYQEKLPESYEFLPTNSLVENLRLIKDDEEVELIETACQVVDASFKHILNYIRPGVTEREVMLELEGYIRRNGKSEIAFDTIVASGPRSALPHGLATERVLKNGDLVTLDYGAKYCGYCSDITRTVVIGKPDIEQKKVYQTVLTAMNIAIDGCRPGAVSKDVDFLARGYIHKAGYGEYFGHSLGHSIGRTVHDGPGLAATLDMKLVPGMITTVEPGIYIPGWGGVRIEQDVLITEGEPLVLTHSPTELLSLPYGGEEVSSA